MAHWLRFVELGALLLGLSLLARLATRIKVSPIPLYLLGGLAFGEGGLLPLVTSEEFVEVGADLGIVLLLLVLGLEYSADELTAALRVSGPSGLVNAVLNFVPGLAAGLLLAWDPLAAVFLGGVTYVSSSGIISKLLEDLRWTGNRETSTVIALVVMEDLTMAVYLPVVGVLVTAAGVGPAVVSVALALAAVAAVLFVAARFGEHISRAVFTHSDETLLLTVVGLTLVMAGLMEGIKVSAAVGAFFVGLALSGPAAHRVQPLLHPLRDLFAAVFFVFFSLRVDPSALGRVLLPAAALAVVTAGTKVATAWYAGHRAGLGKRGRWRAALLLVSRGEFSVAIAGIAVSAGIEPDLGAFAAAYVLILAIGGPVAVRLVGPRLSPAPLR